MNELILFTDGSVNTRTNVGFGAYLAISGTEFSDGNFNQVVNVKRFENTSSTKLEIQTLIWAISEIRDFEGKITVYTDSQNIIGLHGRRERLEKNNYYSKAGKQITNFDSYKQFFQILDKLDCEFIKIKGHKRTSVKNDIDRLFTLVDRASRNALREEKSENNIQC